MIPEVQEVITELDSHRQRFAAFVLALDSAELERPIPNSTWLVRDFVAHLATIDEPVERFFRSMREGKGGFRSESGGALNIDTWNDGMVQERRALSMQAVLAESAKSRSAIREEMGRITAEDFAREFTFGGDSKRGPAKVVFGQYLRGWCKHDPMHVVDMLRALPGRNTPEVEAWLDDPAVRGYQAQMNRQA